MPVMSSPSIEDASGGRRFETRQHAQKRGLAAARAAEQREQLALEYVEADIVDRGEITEPLGHLVELMNGRAWASSHGRDPLALLVIR